MDKLKMWFRIKNNRIIVAVVALVVIVGTGIGWIVLSKPEPIIVFKEQIVVEYGDKIIREADVIAEILDREKSNYESVSIVNPELVFDTKNAFRVDDAAMKKAGMDEKGIQMVSDILKERQDIGKKLSEFKEWQSFSPYQTKVITLAVNGKEREYTLEYLVLDTQHPILTGVVDFDTDFNDVPDYTKLFKASDPVDGDLAVVVSGDIFYDQPGIYKLVATAVDKNGNKQEQPFTVTVNEAKSVETESAHSAENEQQNGTERTLVFRDRIMIPSPGPLGVGRILDLEASGLDASEVSIAYKTQSNEITYFTPLEEITLDDLLHESEELCYAHASDLYYLYSDYHMSYQCNLLSTGKYGLTLIDGAGSHFAFVKNPATDTIIANVNGVKTEHIITYYRRFVGGVFDLKAYQES
ncbi:DUF5011 domain-containing protein [Erysipelothrix sp. HDW6C]|uniref:DUF5011 domain-containing protein n=1 Tax=Erysipelothrix sp. HDW6C TaxID=2714930 RepID=UPI00140A46B1|nr:DUF5011 domain-containing protein [Erysipelothrix sp. HDW6C]QIK69200.1 DUF5011 domain-containing protein [Erysipelothrix sp. HDW6C]